MHSSSPTPGSKWGSTSEGHFRGCRSRQLPGMGHGLVRHGAGSSGSSGWWQAACGDVGAASPNPGWLFSRVQPRSQAGSSAGRSSSLGVPGRETRTEKGRGEEAGVRRKGSWRMARRRTRGCLCFQSSTRDCQHRVSRGATCLSVPH